MTLRDLTKRQIYNLQRKCKKLRRIHCLEPKAPNVYEAYTKGFNDGLKAGLACHSSEIT